MKEPSEARPHQQPTLRLDLYARIDELLNAAYREAKLDSEYQEDFAEEGHRKASYIVNNLRYRETKGELITSDLGYLCVGGADGSEVMEVLTGTAIAYAVLVEISE